MGFKQLGQGSIYNLDKNTIISNTETIPATPGVEIFDNQEIRKISKNPSKVVSKDASPIRGNTSSQPIRDLNPSTLKKHLQAYKNNLTAPKPIRISKNRKIQKSPGNKKKLRNLKNSKIQVQVNTNENPDLPPSSNMKLL